MEILEFGDREKRKIILIHGFQMPYQIWNKYIDYYKNDFHIIVPIMPGHYPNHAENFVSFSETAKELKAITFPSTEECFMVYAMSWGYFSRCAGRTGG